MVLIQRTSPYNVQRAINYPKTELDKDDVMPKPARQWFADVLENHHNKHLKGHWIDGFLVGLILLNVIAIILESVSWIGHGYRVFFTWFERFSVAIFTVEYFVRVWCCVDIDEYKTEGISSWQARVHYIFSIKALIDLLAVLPSYFAMFTQVDLRILRVFRLLRVFKLTRYSRAMSLLLVVLKEEKKSLFAAFFVLFIIMLLASSGIYLIEHEVQPEKFGSIPDAMWWAMATLTTVGYGDVTPITPLGKFFGSCITITSMGIVALPAGIFASGFSEQLNRRRKRYELMLTQVLMDGKITEDEKEGLETLREKLGIDKDEAELMLGLAKRKQKPHLHFCPNCGEDLSKHQHIEP